VKFTLAQINRHIGGRLIGNPETEIVTVSGLREARPGHLCFLANRRYLKDLKDTAASAIIIPSDIEPPSGKNIIVHPNPSLAFTEAFTLIHPPQAPVTPGISAAAEIAPDAIISKDASVLPMAFIDRATTIGSGTAIHPFAYIGANCRIGENCLIYPHVTIREGSIIGNNVIIHPGAVIGSDGFGYITIDDNHIKIPQVGIVEIEDDVEIGANVAIDRARFQKTLIKRGTKIDNLVQIAHNVHIGEHCLIVAQSGISGSAEIGHHSTLAGQSGIAGHIQVGHHSIITGQAGLTKSIPQNSIVSGMPARPRHIEQRAKAALYKLPELIKTISLLEQRIRDLEKKAGFNRPDPILTTIQDQTNME